MFDFYNESLKRMRFISKKNENRNKPACDSKDTVSVGDFVFSDIPSTSGDSGSLLLAQNKRNAEERYLVKHCYTDCACNEFVYTKLAQEMGYSMPDAVLFRIESDKDLERFRTEYVIGERFLNVVEENPSYEVVRETAVNREQYFAFYGLYAMTGEGDGVEILLADIPY